MSSTNRGAKRNDNDRYITPSETIESLLSVMKLCSVANMSFLEPCLGTGEIYDRIPARTKQYAEIEMGIDYLNTSFGNVDLIVTNPPFSLALPFLEKSLVEGRSVIYLLRLNFLGSQKRKSFWNFCRPSHIFVLSKRPSFRGNGETDSTEYAWFAWDWNCRVVKVEAGVHVL